MALTIDRLPYPLSEKGAGFVAQLATRKGRVIDHAISGIPFLDMAGPQFPFAVETVDMRKEQSDVEPDPGEQSLRPWWLRSQSSWHEGAGAVYQETRGNLADSFRFHDSENIDPWTVGELRPEKKLNIAPAAVAPFTALRATDYPGINRVAVGRINSVTTVNAAGTVTDIATVSGTVLDTIVDSDSWYALVKATDNNYLYAGVASDSVGHNVSLSTGISNYGKLLWAKHRLWAISKGTVFQIQDAPGLRDGTSTNPGAPVFTSPDPHWRYTCIADGPNGVYVGGNGTGGSSIALVTIDDVLNPVIGPTVAQLPRGESLQQMQVLGGSYMALGTSRGIRIAQIGSDGSLVYGPLTINLDKLYPQDDGVQVTGSCVGLETYGSRFITAFTIYKGTVTLDGAALCAYQVDVATQFDDGTFAWAKGCQVTSGVPTNAYVGGLTITNDGSEVLGISANGSGVGVYIKSRTEYVADAWVEMSLVRFRTAENKTWRSVSLVGEMPAGSITVDLLVNNSTLPIGGFTRSGSAITQPLEVPTNLGPQSEVGVKFSFTATSTNAPLLRGYQIRATPSVRPQRRITLPLQCHDMEMWQTGQKDGFDGWGRERLLAMQGLENTGDLVVWQDFTEKVPVGALVQIEKMQFIRTVVPNPKKLGTSWGGVLVLTLVTMDV